MENKNLKLAMKIPFNRKYSKQIYFNQQSGEVTYLNSMQPCYKQGLCCRRTNFLYNIHSNDQLKTKETNFFHSNDQFKTQEQGLLERHVNKFGAENGQ